SEVSTIHKSKGLAYEVVMIPVCRWKIDGMTNGDFWIDVQGSPFHELGKIPVKYTQSLAKSIFYQQYYEEMLFNYMDALNTFYVANTRAIEHLYITAPQFKELQNNTAQDKPTFEIKDEYISDLLHQVLAKEQSPYPMEEERIKIDYALEREQKEYDAEQEQTISLANYPLSQELEK